MLKKNEGGVKGKKIESTEFSDTTLYDTIMVDTCHYTFIQTHKMHNNKNEPHCKLQTLGDNMSTQVHQF